MPGKEQSDAQSITILASPGDSLPGRRADARRSERRSLAMDNGTDGNNYRALLFDRLAGERVNKLVVGDGSRSNNNLVGDVSRATSIKVRGRAAGDR